jgi:toxin ParE1/3/4
MKVVKSRLARQDLAEAIAYIAERNREAANRLLADVEFRLGQLIDNPELGPGRPDIGADVRSLSISPLIALYQIKSNKIEVRRIVHGRRDISAELLR